MYLGKFPWLVPFDTKVPITVRFLLGDGAPRRSGVLCIRVSILQIRPTRDAAELDQIGRLARLWRRRLGVGDVQNHAEYRGKHPWTTSLFHIDLSLATTAAPACTVLSIILLPPPLPARGEPRQ